MDLVAEFTKTPVEDESNEHCMDEKSVGQIAVQEPLQWKVYVDGVANQKGSGVRLGFSATNNEAEYETLLEGMSMVHKMGGKSVTIFLYSRLVVGQVKN